MKSQNRSVILAKELSWKVKKGIIFDEKTENFIDYLKKEKIVYIRPKQKFYRFGAIIVNIALLIVFIYSTIMLAQSILNFIDRSSAEIQSDIFSVLVIATFLASVLGQLLVMGYIFFKYFLTNSGWSSYHDQTLSLFERIEGQDLIDDYIKYDSKSQKFKLVLVSVDFQLEWIFPFIFEAFPPLLTELLLISFLLPFSIATGVSILIALFSVNWADAGLLSFLMFLILLGFYSSLKSILNSWRKYHLILSSLIEKQKAIIHESILENADELFILRNEHNLTRLELRQHYPLPFIIRISALLPLFGSFFGYLIGIALLI